MQLAQHFVNLKTLSVIVKVLNKPRGCCAVVGEAVIRLGMKTGLSPEICFELSWLRQNELLVFNVFKFLYTQD
jgi:hypothetical protein